MTPQNDSAELTSTIEAQPVQSALERQRRVALFRTLNLALPAAFLALGIALIVSGFGYGLFSAGQIGSGLFPVVIGTVFVVLSALWFFAPHLRQLPAAAEEGDDSDSDLPDRHGLISIGATMIACVAYLLLLPMLGYQISMSLLIFALVKVVANRRWWSSAVMGLVFGIGTFSLFVQVLNVALPISGISFLRGLGL